MNLFELINYLEPCKQKIILFDKTICFFWILGITLLVAILYQACSYAWHEYKKECNKDYDDYDMDFRLMKEEQKNKNLFITIIISIVIMFLSYKLMHELYDFVRLIFIPDYMYIKHLVNMIK